MTGIYRFADKKIKIISIYDDVHEYCNEYISDGEPDFTVVTTMNDIEYEKKRSAGNYFNYNGYLEELAVYRKIAEKMPEYNTFLFHGSAVAVDGQAYLFTAKSGTGKSTHTRLWRKLLGERALMVNDDKPLIHVDKNGAVVFGTPYNGKHHLGNNISMPLKAVCILERSDKNNIHQITKGEAYTILIQQSYRPADAAALAKTLVLIDKMSDHVTFWKLGCNMDIEAADIAYNTMRK